MNRRREISKANEQLRELESLNLDYNSSRVENEIGRKATYKNKITKSKKMKWNR